MTVFYLKRKKREISLFPRWQKSTSWISFISATFYYALVNFWMRSPVLCPPPFQEFEQFNKRLGDVSRHVRIPLPVSNVLWEHCIRLANRTLVEGWAIERLFSIKEMRASPTSFWWSCGWCFFFFFFTPLCDTVKISVEKHMCTAHMLHDSFPLFFCTTLWLKKVCLNN